MAHVHFFLNPKGGTGKSLFSYITAQYLISLGADLFFVTQQIILVCCVFFCKALSGRSYFPRSSNTTISGATSVRTGGPQKP